MIHEGNTQKYRLRRSAKVVNALLASALSLGAVSINVAAETVWQEDFEASELQGKGATGPIEIGTNVTIEGVDRWSIDVSTGELSATSDWFRVQNGAMQARDVDGEVVWQSESIDITGQGDITIDALLSKSGTMEESDYIDVFYSVDGGTFELITPIAGSAHTVQDDFESGNVSAAIGSGSSLVLKVVMSNNAGTEYLNLESITVTGSGATDGGDTPDEGGEPSSELLFISGACFNCPDLEAVNLASDYVASDYYAALDAAIANGESAQTLKETAHNIIENGHRTLSYSEVWTALTYTDEDPANSNNIILFYKGIS
ncbi:ribonuclease, partial [Alteromonadaceae bacterium A_SAG4]|nr:ribonuclease [Alteromonadaceae bacterium A_SAG4]